MNLNKVIGHDPDVITRNPSNRFILPNCLIGLEIEFERANMSRIDGFNSPYWVFDRDGSLRDGGIEAILRTPLNGEDLENAINSFERFFNGGKTGKFSYRCSVHVHIDIRDMTFETLFNFLMLYTIFEKSIFHLIDNGREDNIFCLPIYKASAGWEDFYSIFFNDKIKDDMMRREFSLREIHKYSAINVKPMTRFGSVEFRHMEGTADSGRLIWWINLLQRLKMYAFNKDIDPRSFIAGISERGPEAIAANIFNEVDCNNLIHNTSFVDDVYSGMRIAQDFINTHECKLAEKARELKNLESFEGRINSELFDEWHTRCVGFSATQRAKEMVGDDIPHLKKGIENDITSQARFMDPSFRKKFKKKGVREDRENHAAIERGRREDIRPRLNNHFDNFFNEVEVRFVDDAEDGA